MLTTELYPYQKPAVDKFVERGNLLLAWEMGLGKTLAAIAAAETLQQAGSVTRCLFVVPASLKWQWSMEVAKHTSVPTLDRTIKGEHFTLPVPSSLITIDGTAKQRKKQFYQAYEESTPYIVCSYDTVVSDPRWIRRLHAEMVVIDEASAIKNFGTKRSKAVKRLAVPFRLALTGTPVENRPDEAFSIMQWVDDTVLGDWDLFERTFVERDAYDNVIEHKNLPLFHSKMVSAMDRKGRTDEDVAPYIPEADHAEWYVDLEPNILEPYRAIASDLSVEIRRLRGGRNSDMAQYYSGQTLPDEQTPLGRVMARQLALEMLLDHPDLVINSALDYQESETQRQAGVERAQWPGSRYAYEVWDAGVLDNAIESAKLERLVREVHKIIQHEGSKVLIFTRFTYMLAIIEDALGVQCVSYHGGLSAGAKAAAVRRFANAPDIQVFLSSHAGAYGTDMRMANWLINYDLPWSWGRFDQINGRHQRAASEFDLVYVRNMITRGTIEERKLEMLAYKRSLADAVVDGKVGVSGKIANDMDSLSTWLEEYI